MREYIYLVRHGHVERHVPRKFLGQRDVPLSHKGVKQAQQLGRTFSAHNVDHVFSSPLLRSRKTAELVCGLPAARINPIEQFSEINLGKWDGLTVQQVRDLFPGQYEARGDNFAAFRPEAGESFIDLQNRVLPTFLELTRTFSGSLLVVAHAGVNRVILSSLQDIPLDQLLTIPQDYCGVNLIQRTASGLQVVKTNCNAF